MCYYVIQQTIFFKHVEICWNNFILLIKWFLHTLQIFYSLKKVCIRNHCLGKSLPILQNTERLLNIQSFLRVRMKNDKCDEILESGNHQSICLDIEKHEFYCIIACY